MDNLEKTITVKIKNNYGSDSVYPVCKKARLFAEISVTRTLTQGTIDRIKALGFAVKVEGTQDRYL